MGKRGAICCVLIVVLAIVILIAAVNSRVDDSDGSSSRQVSGVTDAPASIETPLQTLDPARCGLSVAFVVDESGSISEPQWAIAIDMLHQVAVVEPSFYRSNTRLTVLSYATFNDLRFGWTDPIHAAEALEQNVRNSKGNGGTRTGAAIEQAGELFEPSEEIPREVQALVVLTDGSSNSKAHVESSIKGLPANISTFAIGLGEGALLDELTIIARNDSERIFIAKHYGQLPEIQRYLVRELNELLEPLCAAGAVPTSAPGMQPGNPFRPDAMQTPSLTLSDEATETPPTPTSAATHSLPLSRTGTLSPTLLPADTATIAVHPGLASRSETTPAKGQTTNTKAVAESTATRTLKPPPHSRTGTPTPSMSPVAAAPNEGRVGPSRTITAVVEAKSASEEEPYFWVFDSLTTLIIAAAVVGALIFLGVVIAIKRTCCRVQINTERSKELLDPLKNNRRFDVEGEEDEAANARRVPADDVPAGPSVLVVHSLPEQKPIDIPPSEIDLDPGWDDDLPQRQPTDVNPLELEDPLSPVNKDSILPSRVIPCAPESGSPSPGHGSPLLRQPTDTPADHMNFNPFGDVEEYAHARPSVRDQPDDSEDEEEELDILGLGPNHGGGTAVVNVDADPRGSHNAVNPIFLSYTREESHSFL